MDEINLKRSEQDYYVSTDNEASPDVDESVKPSIVSHKIEKGEIVYVIKNDATDSTQTLSTDDIESPLYLDTISEYIKKKVNKTKDKNKIKNELSLIKGCQKIKNEIKYSVVFMDGHEELLSSFEMRQNYMNDLLSFLERKAINSNS